jgi:hypothetical protein
MTNFDHFVASLESLGFAVERGMLVGEGHFANASQIGTRFSTAVQQIDTYTQSAFFQTDKSHPVLGASETIDGPEGAYTVTAIVAE